MGQAGDGRVEVTWLGQAGFVLTGSGGALVVDAFLSDRPQRLRPAPVTAADLSYVDAVLCTHEHLDHLDLPAVLAVMEAAPDARLILPAPIVDQAVGVPTDRIVPAAPGTPIEVPGATVHPVPAYHGVEMADAYGFGPVKGEYPYLGYVVDIDGVRVYHAGDTLWYDGMPERLRELRVDVTLLPINGRDPIREAANIVGNLDHREAALLAAAAGAHTVVPMHYDMMANNRGFPGHLVDVVAALDLDLHVLVPRLGRPFTLTATAERRAAR